MQAMKIALITLITAALISGCASKSTRVSRVDTNTEIALTDRWNDKDSQLVSEEMIQDMLSFPWIRDFRSSNGGEKPTIIIQRVRNKSHEHISAETFLNDLKRAIIRSGDAYFVAGGSERSDVREERADQEINAANAKQMGNEQAADFALSGSINSFVDQLDGTRVTTYQIDLKLINMENNIEVWNGQKKLKKLQEKDSYGW
ncbi:penicillin-binding protein activator LpoB [Bermanella marisrubri]|uniref:Putative lipoprotein n=1 Tax=Bermanella marisrubri TaxID=207949 RepID=Q1MZK9_9GAMM|nr:penicillin-binding protein activator LpoB [Bermanella marisrubri]EAT11402.1 putative lipoprotein [Oceanobacter sp. RED65] [Bermanella marisrubri]QIZ85599.1 penicillin-binding protein activator LpoB [Bermanella marisrubri]